ncbi:hypothetical protein AVEN_264535-1 [Araneus ventricosus]|uniref:Uncharacterized protein n=1 Tax=Araneus ventricosus TaxID=182803 RepID=A0A4Y2G9U7_ARAVE|nr:hypothetical protein AVEN_264535-1 [Araneus ventricosus]
MVGSLTHDVRFTVTRPTYAADLQRNRVSNLEPSGIKYETFLLGHGGPRAMRQSSSSRSRRPPIDFKAEPFHTLYTSNAPCYFNFKIPRESYRNQEDIGLFILMYNFEATRELFWDGPS